MSKSRPNRPASMWDGPIQTPARCYTGKVPYASHGEAQWHAQRSTAPLRPYRCWNCGAYHLAARDNNSRRNHYHDFVIRQPVKQEQDP